MAAKRKAAAKIALAPRPVCSAAVREQAALLRAKAAGQSHGGTQLELRVQALEMLVEALTA
jgi:hypothetical protein